MAHMDQIVEEGCTGFKIIKFIKSVKRVGVILQWSSRLLTHCAYIGVDLVIDKTL